MTPTKLLSFVTDEKNVVLDGTKLQIVISNDANDHQLNSLWCHVHCHRPCVVAALLSNALVALSIGDFQEPSEAPILMKYCTPSVAKHLQCSTARLSTAVVPNSLVLNCSCSPLLHSIVVLHFSPPLQLVLSTELQLFSRTYNFSPLLHSTKSLSTLCFAWQCISGQRAMIARSGGLPHNCTTRLTSFKITPLQVSCKGFPTESAK